MYKVAKVRLFTYIILVCMAVIASSPVIAQTIEVSQTTSAQEMLTQNLATLGSESVFERIQVQFSETRPELAYTLRESTSPIFEEYRELELMFATDSISHIQLFLKIPLQNDASITANNLLILKEDENTFELEPIGHTIIRTDAQYIFANARITPVYTYNRIILTNSELEGELALHQESENQEQQTTQDQDTAQTPSEEGADSEVIQADTINQILITDEMTTRSPLGAILIGVGIIATIILIIISVMVKHKVGPTKVTQVERHDLALEVSQAIAKQKSNGQIVSELITKKYEITDIIAELEKQGRSVTKHIK